MLAAVQHVQPIQDLVIAVADHFQHYLQRRRVVRVAGVSQIAQSPDDAECYRYPLICEGCRRVVFVPTHCGGQTGEGEQRALGVLYVEELL